MTKVSGHTTSFISTSKRSIGKTGERLRRSSHGPRTVSRRSSERGERKSGCPSEASYLIFRPASVAKSREAHEALTFGLLLGQAKSDRKEIMSGFQPSKQGADMDTPPLRDRAEIYRACSPCAPCGQTYRVHGIRTQITVFVIPNIVRNLVEKRKEILPRWPPSWRP